MANDRSRIDARPRVVSVSRKLGVYLCPKCRRQVKRVKRPKRCCGIPLFYLGSVNEEIAEEKETP